MTEQVYHLEPGYVFVSAHGAIIRTVVGSCISVCLWDEQRRLGGMNHFLYPETTDRKKSTAQYGNVAMPALIKLMEKLGSKPRDLVAQLYGGGQLHNLKKNVVGEENITIARNVLKKRRIPVISEDVGGKMGRKILFDTETGHAAIFKVHRLRQTDWIEYRN